MPFPKPCKYCGTKVTPFSPSFSAVRRIKNVCPDCYDNVSIPLALIKVAETKRKNKEVV